MSHLQDENPYIVHEKTDILESILKLFKHQESDPNKVLKMKIEKFAELQIQYYISEIREKDFTARWLRQSDRSSSKPLLYKQMKKYEKKVKQLGPQMYGLWDAIEKLRKNLQGVHNHMHGDSEMYTRPNIEQLTIEWRKLNNDQKLQKDQLEKQLLLLKNLKDTGDKKKFQSDQKSYEKEIKKLKDIIERTQAKINILKDDQKLTA